MIDVESKEKRDTILRGTPCKPDIDQGGCSVGVIQDAARDCLCK